MAGEVERKVMVVDRPTLMTKYPSLSVRSREKERIKQDWTTKNCEWTKSRQWNSEGERQGKKLTTFACRSRDFSVSIITIRSDIDTRNTGTDMVSFSFSRSLPLGIIDRRNSRGMSFPFHATTKY